MQVRSRRKQPSVLSALSRSRFMADALSFRPLQVLMNRDHEGADRPKVASSRYWQA